MTRAASIVAAGLAVAGLAGACRAKPRDDDRAAWIACGGNRCDARFAYCEIVLSDVPDPPTDYACKPLPAACLPRDGRAASCGCFPAGTRCRSFCGHLESGGPLEGFHLTCRL